MFGFAAFAVSAFAALGSVSSVNVSETTTITDVNTVAWNTSATNTESFALYLSSPIQENSYFGATPFAAIPFGGVSNFTGNTYEQIVATLTTNQTVSETTTLTDIESASATFAGAISEPVTITDTQTVQSDLVGAVSETTTLTDVNTVAWNTSASTVESFTLTEVQTGNLSANVSVPETVTLTDAASSSASFSATTAESFALYLTGPVAENSYFGATPFAAIPFAGVSNFTGKTYEQIVATLTTNQTVTESLTLTTTQSAYVNFAPQIIEAVLTTDATTATAIMFVTTAESFYAADTLIQRGWIKIDDDQSGVWTAVPTNTTSWSIINNTQNPGWVDIDDSQG